MPLLDKDKPRSQLSTWWMASWLVGLATWAVLIQAFVFGSASLINTGVVRLLLFVGIGLSAVDGIAYVKGGEPHVGFRKQVPNETMRMMAEEGQHGVVVMNNIPAAAPQGPRRERTGPAHTVLYAAPRALGDAVLTGVWKLAARALGRDERAVLAARNNDQPTGEIHHRAQPVVNRQRSRYRIFRP